MHQDTTAIILHSYFRVYNTLGFGFLEKVYENALAREISRNGCCVERQKKITVYYDGFEVGEYYADIVVNNLVIIEIKAVDVLREEHHAQVLNYLRSTKIELGILLNFGKKPEFRRKIFTNDRKS